MLNTDFSPNDLQTGPKPLNNMLEALNYQETNNSASIYHVPSFLVKLFEIVDNTATDTIISWLEPEGDGFIIKQPSQFCDTILPQYFKHSNFSSFIRQLNMYDFHKSKRKGD